MSAAGTVTQRGPQSWRLKVERHGKQHTRTVRAGSRRDAAKLLAGFVVEIDEGRVSQAPARMTTGQFIDHWLAGLTVADSTAYNYRSVAKRLKADLGTIALRNLAPLDIRHAFVKWSKDLEPSTLGQHRLVLGKALADAVRLDYLARSPMDKLRGMLPTGAPKEATPANAAAIAEALEDRGSIYFAPILLCASTGCRRGEALAIRWCDIDADKLTISRQLRPDMTFGPTKTRKTRAVTIPAFAVEELRALRRRMVEKLFATGRRLTDDDLVCLNKRGLPIDPKALSRFFQKRYGGKLHGTRHYHASALLSAGINVRAVSARLGHANAKITLAVYSHLMPGDDEAAAAAIDKAITG